MNFIITSAITYLKRKVNKMKKSVLKFDKVSGSTYHTIIKNNHGRKIYLKISRLDEAIIISDCFYIDRPMRNGCKTIPQKQTTSKCSYSNLTDILSCELDKYFYAIEFSENETSVSTEEYIAHYLESSKKYKFLILVEFNGTLKTRLKNRVHRTIYLEIKQNVRRGLIQTCYYCDRRYKRNNRFITPFGLKTIYFDYSPWQVLKVVNDELNCDFTDVIITKDTFGFESSDIPICGSI